MKRNFLRILSVGIMSTAAWQAQGAVADHLVISEVGSNAVADAEYCEIFNPTPNPIDLTNYWLTDYQQYQLLPADSDGLLNSGTTDNILRFPAGSVLASGQCAVVVAKASVFLTDQFGGSLANYTGQTGSPLLFELAETNGSVPNMISKNGSAGGAEIWNFTNPSDTNGEHLRLFWWDGSADLVKDVDVVIWGGTPLSTASNAPLFKTPATAGGKNGATYLQDNGSQANLTYGNNGLGTRVSILEDGEPATGGNGLTGHDDSMENISVSWLGSSYVKRGSPGATATPGTTTLPVYSGNLPPQIGEVERDIQYPSTTQTITLSAQVSDSDGTVATVKFYVDSGSGFAPVNGVNNAGTWTAAIGPFANNTLVKYYVEATDNSAATKVFPPTAPASFRQFVVNTTPITPGTLVINEVLYDWIGTDANGAEWVEIYNTKNVPLDLSYVSFADGNKAWFTFPGGTTIPANGYVIVTQESTVFAGYYGANPNGAQVFDYGTVQLNNSPETLYVRHVNGWDFGGVETYIDRVDYDTVAPWPSLSSNSDGQSMELIHPNLDNSDGNNWKGNILTTPPISTPGARNSVFAGVYVTSVTRSLDFPPANTPVTITANVTPVTSTTVSSAKIYYSTNAGSSYSSVNMTPTATPGVYTGNIPGQPANTRVRYYVEGTNNQAETGKYPTEAPDKFLMYIPGAVLPTAGSIVINEILYDNVGTDNIEYVELLNTTASPIDIGEFYLTDDSNQPFILPAGVTLPANGYVILTQNGFNFFATYGTPANYYSWDDTFNLNNTTTDTVKFQHPNQYKTDGSGPALSQVTYSQLAPWPTWAGAPAGTATEPDSPNQRGRSIELINPFSVNREKPQLWAWTTRTESPGFMGSPGIQNSVFSTTEVHDWTLY